MSFIGFHPCPKCNSRDNLAEYTDNFYCFGCGYNKPKRNIESYRKRLEAQTEVRVANGITLDKKLDTEHLKWLLGYNLTLDECKQFYSAHERLINNENLPCNLLVLFANADYWLGRNFDVAIQGRYLSSGTKPFIKYGNNPHTLVFVEDIVSAVKVGRVATAVPMLGAKVLSHWWDETTPYARVIIWGDRDKARDNVIASRKATEILGKKVDCIITEKDPKEYNETQIKLFIENT